MIWMERGRYYLNALQDVNSRDMKRLAFRGRDGRVENWYVIDIRDLTANHYAKRITTYLMEITSSVCVAQTRYLDSIKDLTCYLINHFAVREGRMRIYFSGTINNVTRTPYTTKYCIRYTECQILDRSSGRD